MTTSETSLTRQEKRQLREAGAAAFYSGHDTKACPFESLSMRGDQWLIGWWKAYYGSILCHLEKMEDQDMQPSYLRKPPRQNVDNQRKGMTDDNN